MATTKIIYKLFNLNLFSLEHNMVTVLDVWNVLENKIQSLALISDKLKSKLSGRSFFCDNLSTLENQNLC